MHDANGLADAGNVADGAGINAASRRRHRAASRRRGEQTTRRADDERVACASTPRTGRIRRPAGARPDVSSSSQRRDKGGSTSPRTAAQPHEMSSKSARGRRGPEQQSGPWLAPKA
jgi:hypothetical protein